MLDDPNGPCSRPRIEPPGPNWPRGAKILDARPASMKAGIVRTLQPWKGDTDLTAIRDDEALAKLPEPEQKEWQAFWAEVDALLKRARGPKL
jgi:hypothetical protein